MKKEFNFTGVQRMNYCDSFGETTGICEIIITEKNLLKCIKNINEYRKKYIKNNNCFDSCHNFNITYEINIDEDGYYYDTIILYDDRYVLGDDCDYVINESLSYESDYSNICNEYKNNLKKCIRNCLQTDKKKLNFKGNGKLENIGNIDFYYVDNLIEKQNNKCYLCGDKLNTFLYIQYCSYKFSIDRIDNNKPHDKNNIKISCYFCNCKDHILYDKKEKIKCENIECFCNNKLF